MVGAKLTSGEIVGTGSELSADLISGVVSGVATRFASEDLAAGVDVGLIPVEVVATIGTKWMT